MALVGDFEAAGQAVLALLQRRYGFALCMLARSGGDEWTVLQSLAHGMEAPPGTAFRWTDAFGEQLAAGTGLRFGPDAGVTATGQGPPGPAAPFAGEPLLRSDGTLFGTLGVVRPVSDAATAAGEQELMAVLAALLCKILQDELKAMEDARRCERLEAEILTDPMTRLYNRRAWDRFLVTEEQRCRRYGHPAAVFSIDLDYLKTVNDTQGHAAGDALIVRTAAVLRAATRSSDIVARLGGDEFGILGIECDRARGEYLLEHVCAALDEANIAAATGFAMRIPAAGLNGAWETADRRMYECKHDHHKYARPIGA